MTRTRTIFIISNTSIITTTKRFIHWTSTRTSTPIWNTLERWNDKIYRKYLMCKDTIKSMIWTSIIIINIKSSQEVWIIYFHFHIRIKIKMNWFIIIMNIEIEKTRWICWESKSNLILLNCGCKNWNNTLYYKKIEENELLVYKNNELLSFLRRKGFLQEGTNYIIIE